jgi:hypothetical protein
VPWGDQKRADGPPKQGKWQHDGGWRAPVEQAAGPRGLAGRLGVANHEDRPRIRSVVSSVVSRPGAKEEREEEEEEEEEGGRKRRRRGDEDDGEDKGRATMRRDDENDEGGYGRKRRHEEEEGDDMQRQSKSYVSQSPTLLLFMCP